MPHKLMMCRPCHNNGDTVPATHLAGQWGRTLNEPARWLPVCESHHESWWPDEDAIPRGEGLILPSVDLRTIPAPQ